MKSLDSIRNDLINIRYYYSRKATFDMVENTVGKCSIVDLAKKYNDAIRNAPPRLYDIYICLYILTNTQESLAAEMHYTQQSIQTHHKNLILYLQNQIFD